METLTFLLIVIVCIAISAFFSSSETALLRLRTHDLKKDIDAARGPAALAARDLITQPSRLLVTILLGNNLVNTLAASAGSAVGIRLLGEERGLIVSALVITAIVFLFGEILPKAVAAQHPRRIAYHVALPLYLVHHALRPLHLLYDRLVDPWVKRIAGGSGDTPTSTGEDILRLARTLGAEAGTPLAIINATAGAGDTTVADIMIPRAEIVAFPIATDPSQLLDSMLEERYTRVPIYEESVDDVLGVIHLKDLAHFVRRDETNLRSILKPVLRVPERKPILPLLADMQRAFVHVAIVKDEFGITLGMLTQEDILEELVGEIRDEFDREELKAIRKLENNRYQCLGRIKVQDFNRETGWCVPAERGDTFAGLLFNKLGRGPRRGESVRVPGYRIVVADLSGTRVAQVQVFEESLPAQDEE